jgi:DNA-binding GntR family transcriptional regulator
MREAIRLLAADGLVEVVPHQGATVRAPSLAELDELYEIRSVLEAHAAARAAGRRSAEEAAGLLALVAEMEAIPVANGAERLDAEATLRQRSLDIAFHARVLEVSGLARLRHLVEDAGIIARPFETMDASLSVADLRSACRHHRAIGEAIAEGNPDLARTAMAAHIDEGRLGAQARVEQWGKDRDGGVPEALRPFLR